MPRTKTRSDDGKRYPLNMRTTKETRERLERAAAASGRSLAQEVEYRLEKSFSEEDVFDRLIGGPVVRQKAQLMVSAFLHAGTMESHALGHPERSPGEWMQDPACYRAGTFAVFDSLVSANPDAGWQIDHFEGLKSRPATMARHAEWQMTRHAGRRPPPGGKK
jgi:hypothetical protein